MIERAHDATESEARARQERREFRSYAWGASIALVLTLVPFALVHWGLAARTSLYIIIGLFALAQMVVHFRCFLHIGIRQQRADLQLILFSTLVLVIMVAGTLWIMASLAQRMAMH